MIRENEIESRAFQSVACKDAERARLAARVAELEARTREAEESNANALARLSAAEATIELRRIENEAVRHQVWHAENVCDAMEKRVLDLEERVKRLEEAGDILGDAADAADIDIGQHLQVANYNLHGLLNTGDRVNPPNPPHTIHQDGIDESVVVRQKVRQARQAWQQAKEAKP
jgi:hypothetical protein